MTELPIKIRDWKRINYYPVSAEKLNKITAKEVALLLMPINVGEDYEYFDEIKHLLEISEPRKSIEEIQQELNKKFDELFVKTKRKFFVSRQSAENNYNRQFDRIFDNFENLRKYGSVSTYGTVLTIGSKEEYQFAYQGNPSKYWKCYLFGNKPGSYGMVYTPQEKEVPNAFVRWCSNVFLGCKWVKEKENNV